jgi:hypothetical protein
MVETLNRGMNGVRGKLGTLETPINHRDTPASIASAVAAGLFADPNRMKQQEIDRLGAECVALTHGDPLAFLPGAVVAHLICRCLRDHTTPLRQIVEESLKALDDQFGREYRQTAQVIATVRTALKYVDDFDIFPVDAVIDDPDLFQKQYQEAKALRASYTEKAKWNVRYHEGPNPVKNVVKGVVKSLNNSLFKKKYDYLKDYRAFENVCARYNNEETKYLSLLSFQFDNPKHYKTREGWKNIVYKDFEFMQMPVTSDYDEILTIQYGDYMKMQKVSTIHGGLIIDTNQSYKDYFKNKEKK